MKKILFLLSVVCSVSCNKGKQPAVQGNLIDTTQLNTSKVSENDYQENSEIDHDPYLEGNEISFKWTGEKFERGNPLKR